MAHAPGDETQRRRAHGHTIKTPDPFVFTRRVSTELGEGHPARMDF